MQTKLTLSLHDDVIADAKAYARKNRTSLSLIVENYFKFLMKKKPDAEKTISPTVKELTGIIQLPEDVDPKAAYTDYLTEKYS